MEPDTEDGTTRHALSLLVSAVLDRHGYRGIVDSVLGDGLGDIMHGMAVGICEHVTVGRVHEGWVPPVAFPLPDLGRDLLGGREDVLKVADIENGPKVTELLYRRMAGGSDMRPVYRPYNLCGIDGGRSFEAYIILDDPYRNKLQMVALVDSDGIPAAYVPKGVLDRPQLEAMASEAGCMLINKRSTRAPPLFGSSPYPMNVLPRMLDLDTMCATMSVMCAVDMVLVKAAMEIGSRDGAGGKDALNAGMHVLRMLDQIRITGQTIDRRDICYKRYASVLPGFGVELPRAGCRLIRFQHRA